MGLFNRRLSLRIAGLVAIIAIATIIGARLIQPEALPIYNPSQVNPALVDQSVRGERDHHIANFSLTDQNGQTITQNTYKDKIYVANFFFTTCKSICIPMTRQMKRVQDAFEDDPQVMLLSHSVTPKIDSVAQLKRFALKKGVDDQKWHLVTGDKKVIYELARKSYFAATTKGDGGANDFIHTQNLVLVDKEKRIRGFYNGTDPKDVDRLIGDIKTLEHEY